MNEQSEATNVGLSSSPSNGATVAQEREALIAIKRIRYSNDVASADTDLLYQILMSTRSRAVRAAVVQTLRVLQDRYEGAPILMGGKFVQLDIAKPSTSAFLLYILDVFGVKGAGNGVVGYVSDGSIESNQLIVLEKADGRDIQTRCLSVSCAHSTKIAYGSLVHIFLEELSMGEIAQGDALRGMD